MEEPEMDASSRPDADNPIGGNGVFPAGWEYRLDDANPDAVVSADTVGTPDIFFVTMTPGWHVTTQRPRGILYHPASTAEGDYMASTKISLFDPGTRREGYGIFVGGSDLQGENPQYLYFLVRRDGQFIIKNWNGGEPETVVDWTPHEAIIPFNDETETTATNTVAIMTMGNMIHFMVNGAEVHTIEEKGDLPTEGIVGLRLNHGLNVHVESLDVQDM